MAVLPSYDSFFSSYSRKPERGYSGTCIFTKRAKCVPVQAEEGISGLLPLDRRPEPSADELIGGTLSSETIALNMQDVRTIDLEGRTTMVDLGLFVLINCYFPNETNEDRLDFKLAFNSMFEARVLALIRAGREVIALGDVNIAAQPIDHCDPVRRASESTYGGYEHHPARKWFNEFTGERGSMVDLARHFHPTKKSMFTHWETRINARYVLLGNLRALSAANMHCSSHRETNYGTRIDYILATPGLLPWIKSCDIQPQVIGSDHCPVIADLHDSIVDEAGNTLHLYNYTNPPGRHQDPAVAIPEPPKLAAKFYPEFGSEQKLLSTFFGKNSKKSAPLSTPDLDLSLQDSAVASGSGRASDTVAEPAVVALPFAGTEAKRSTTVAPILPSSLLETSHITKDSSNPPLPKALPPASSIDLTLAMSDDDDDILPQASTSRSVSTSLLNSSSQPSSARLSQTKTKKGQQTLATFFRPPSVPCSEPAGKSKASKVGKKDSKGKGKEKQQSPIDTGENGIVNGNHAAPDRAIDLDEEEPQGGHHDVEVEDESLRDLREKAMNGSRPSSSMKKRRKSLDFGADEEAAIREVSLCVVRGELLPMIGRCPSSVHRHRRQRSSIYGMVIHLYCQGSAVVHVAPRAMQAVDREQM